MIFLRLTQDKILSIITTGFGDMDHFNHAVRRVMKRIDGLSSAQLLGLNRQKKKTVIFLDPDVIGVSGFVNVSFKRLVKSTIDSNYLDFRILKFFIYLFEFNI